MGRKETAVALPAMGCCLVLCPSCPSKPCNPSLLIPIQPLWPSSYHTPPEVLPGPLAWSSSFLISSRGCFLSQHCRDMTEHRADLLLNHGWYLQTCLNRWEDWRPREGATCLASQEHVGREGSVQVLSSVPGLLLGSITITSWLAVTLAVTWPWRNWRPCCGEAWPWLYNKHHDI